MPRLLASALLAATASVLLASTSAQSQGRNSPWGDTWMPFARDWYDDRPRRYRAPPGNVRTLSSTSGSRAAATRTARPPRDDDDDDAPGQLKPVPPTGPKLLDGGPRPDIAAVPPTPVSVSTGQSAGTVVIDTRGRQLLLVTGSNSALRYPISVGRDGFTWAGTEKISRIADWPDWHPPVEMRERDPRLPEKMTGGIRNPLGAKSLYLGNSLYRIHGTNDARTIGYAASSGCFRMLNGHVVDLSRRIGLGTKVVVLPYLGAKPVATAAPATTTGSAPQTATRTARRSS